MQNTSESYLVTEVMTATPQKLQLMLIDAAIRSAQRALQHWQIKENEQAVDRVLRAQQIVGEMLSALDYEVKSELVKKVAGVYLFVYRALMDAALTHDANKVNEALRVLVVERETWRQICEKLAVLSDADTKATVSFSPTIAARRCPENQDSHLPIQTGHAPVAANLASNSKLIPEMPAASFSMEV